MIRFILMMLWVGAILILTCASNFSGFLLGDAIGFQIIQHPQFGQLSLLPHQITESYIIQKSGHVLSFYLLALIVPYTPYKTRFYLILFALLTELLQLYFGRSGRFIDVGYDTIGIFLGLLFRSYSAKTLVDYREVEWRKGLFLEKRN